MISLVLVASLVAAVPDAGVEDAGTPAYTGPTLKAPLGHIGDVLTAVPPEGYPSTERVVTVTLPGCDHPQAIWLSRFLMGSAVAGAQVHMFLSKQPAVTKKLFGKGDPLADAIQRSRRTSSVVNGCASAESWKLTPAELAEKKCAVPPTTVPADHMFVEKGKLAAFVRLHPADEGAADRCRPKISAILSDDKGVPRFALHADYGGLLSAEVFGDKCQQLAFDFDEASQAFVATPSVRPDCPAKKAKK